MDLQLVLHRFYTPNATLGELSVSPANDGSQVLFQCCTIERPWLDNTPHVSCIPEGMYEMALRQSPVVSKTSGGDFEEGWQVLDVPGRTWIMLHPGNWARNVEGCIAMGREFHPAELMVTSSRETFRDLMNALGEGDSCRLLIAAKAIRAKA